MFVPGVASLVLFAFQLTRVGSAALERAYGARLWSAPMERAYAAYGGVNTLASLAWLWAVKGVRLDRAHVAGAFRWLLGAAAILYGRTAVRPL